TTGFGLLVNWNLLGDGTHTVRALADGTEFARATFTVTTLGVEFLRGVNGNCRLEDFPHSGDSITMRWQESTQNFAIIEKCFSSQPCMMMGPLSVSTANPRYFSDRNGNAVYLTGSPNWYSLQDAGQLGHPVTTLDYNSYLNFLQSHNHNFFRLWPGEGWEASSSTSQYSAPISFRLLGGSYDNNPKFDLHQFDQNYFDRMRQRVLAARDRRIYVSIMLFNGWSIDAKGYPGNPWPGHPFHAKNNVNGIDGDPGNTGQGLVTHTLQIPAITELQEAHVRKVIDTVNDLDNLLYEISNEDYPSAAGTQWQYHMINFVK